MRCQLVAIKICVHDSLSYGTCCHWEPPQSPDCIGGLVQQHGVPMAACHSQSLHSLLTASEPTLVTCCRVPDGRLPNPATTWRRNLDGWLPILEPPQSSNCVGGLPRPHGVAICNMNCLDGHLSILRQHGVAIWMAACQSWSLHSHLTASENSRDHVVSRHG